MSNIPQFNIPKFLATAQELREDGWDIQLPADLDKPESIEILMRSPDGKLVAGKTDEGRTWGEYLADDVKLIADNVQGLIFMEGWENSRGAKLEAVVGVLTGKHFFTVDGAGTVAPIAAREVVEIVASNL